MDEKEMTQRINKNIINASGVREWHTIYKKKNIRALKRKSGRVRGLECALMKYMDRSRWGLFCCGHTFNIIPRNRCQNRQKTYRSVSALQCSLWCWSGRLVAGCLLGIQDGCHSGLLPTQWGIAGFRKRLVIPDPLPSARAERAGIV